MQRTVAIANYFVGRSLEPPGRPLYASSMMALLLFAHGWRMGVGQGPLLAQGFVAAGEGPEIPQLGRLLRPYGSGPVGKPLSLFVPDPAEPGRMRHLVPAVEADDADAPLLDQVWSTLGRESPYLLHQLVTQPYSPWAATRHAGGAGQPPDLSIGDQRIQRWFTPRGAGHASPLEVTLAMIRSKSRSGIGLE